MHPLLWNKTAAVDFQYTPMFQTMEDEEDERNKALWNIMVYPIYPITDKQRILAIYQNPSV